MNQKVLISYLEFSFLFAIVFIFTLTEIFKLTYNLTSILTILLKCIAFGICAL